MADTFYAKNEIVLSLKLITPDLSINFYIYKVIFHVCVLDILDNLDHLNYVIYHAKVIYVKISRRRKLFGTDIGTVCDLQDLINETSLEWKYFHIFRWIDYSYTVAGGYCVRQTLREEFEYDLMCV